MLDKVMMERKEVRKDYDERLVHLEIRMGELQRQCRSMGIPIVIVFEGAGGSVLSDDVLSEELSSLDVLSEELSSLDVLSEELSSLNVLSEELSSLDVSSEELSSLDVLSEELSELSPTEL